MAYKIVGGGDMSKEGVKFDGEKARWDLLPPSVLKLIEVYSIGAQKYEPWNWAKGMAWSRVFAAMMRHSWAWWWGERNDPEDGQHHLASVAWCALALMHYENEVMGKDDRPLDFVSPPPTQPSTT